MKIALYSDIHTEFLGHANWLPSVPATADAIALAGDIGHGDQAAKWVEQLASLHMDKHIIYVAGNHEYYHENISQQLHRFRDYFSLAPRIHFLENETAVIGDVRFLGCTLWTNFNALHGNIPGDIAASAAKKCVNDFRLIENDGRTFTPSKMATLNAESTYWLKQELTKKFAGKTVVVTHFPPCKQLRHGKIPMDELSPYFLNDLEGFINRLRPEAWVYGHNHWCDDREIHGCRVVTNQLGYPHENQLVNGFRDDLLIEV